MKKLMILGAGIYQVPLIKKAREMGLETIVVSYPGPYPGLEMADRTFLIDTTDTEAILDAARSEHIDGIVTTGTDVAVRTIGVVCDTLNLPGVNERTAIMLTDKAAMKEMFAAGGVPTSSFAVVETLDAALEAAERIGFPVMVKACDVSGSRGITKVERRDEVRAAFNAALAATHADHIIVERFVEGDEIGIDGFVQNGELALFAPHDKFVFRANNVTIPAGHAFPLHVSDEILARAKDAIIRAIKASGLISGAFNSDVILTPNDNVSILEMGARCGATCIPELITMYTGIDYYAEMIRAALGEVTELQPSGESVPCMSKLLFSRTGGIIQSIDYDTIADIEQHYSAIVNLDIKPGSTVRHVHDGTDRYGSIIMPTEREDAINRVLFEVEHCITWQDKTGN